MIGCGVHRISSDEYHADPCEIPSLSRGTIKDLLYKSAAYVKMSHPKLNSNHKTVNEAKFDIGTAAHAMLLEGEDVVHVIDEKDWRKKSAQEERDIAYENGKTPLLAEQYEIVKAMTVSAEKQIADCRELKINDLRTDGDAELTYIWERDKTLLRVRPDWISKDRTLILDYKTTAQSADPATFARNVVTMGYDIQAAMYPEGVKSVEGIKPKFIFVVQETYEPYLCSFIGLPPEFLAMGQQKMEYGIYLWEQYMLTGNWPGYPNKVCWLDTPPWALASWEQKAEMIGGM